MGMQGRCDADGCDINAWRRSLTFEPEVLEMSGLSGALSFSHALK